MPTRIDLQRYKKTYPFLRREPRSHYITDRPMQIETAEVSFSGSDQLTYTFTSVFTSIPKVTVTPVGASADVNIFVSTISSTSVSIQASAPNNFSVHIHVIEVT